MPELAWSWIDLAQLVLAVVLGCLIGYLRELAHKPAGITTITLVTLTATLIMQLSYKLPSSGGIVGDPARLAAAVITGIGFLGAGVILRHGTHVQGITTAATIWLMAGVGLAIGAGYYIPAMVVVLLAWIGFLVDPYTQRFIEQRRKKLTEERTKDSQRRG
ncbi:MgtC/SapB family protein [bacterium]|nr:MgtC/SapB family protein [bacterium]